MSKLLLADRIETILRAQESAGWMVGDLIVAEKGTQAEKVEVYLREDLAVRLEARGLDIEYERLRAYYRVALANPQAKRNGVSFTAAEEAGTRPERFDWYAQFGSKLGKRQVRKLRGDRALDHPLNDGTTRQKAATLKQLLDDADAVEEALRDNPRLRSKLAGAVADPIPADDWKTGHRSGGRRGAEWGEGDRLAEELDRFAQSLAQRYQALAGTLHPEHAVQNRLLTSISGLRSTLDLFESGLTQGLTFDQFVASLSL